MSHFTTILILPEGIDEELIDQEVDRLMERYSENREVPAQPKDCSCINMEARISAQAHVDATYRSIEEIRKEFRTLPEAERTNERWLEAIAEYTRLEEEAMRAHPLYQKPSPTCEDCEGTGIYQSTYNPDSKWDWYSYGGRWNGAMCGKPRDDGEGGFNFADEFRRREENQCLVREIAPDFRSFAILTPDGEWHERGEMGWWGIVTDEKPEVLWEAEYAAILERYPDHLAVLLDCHI